GTRTEPADAERLRAVTVGIARPELPRYFLSQRAAAAGSHLEACPGKRYLGVLQLQEKWRHAFDNYTHHCSCRNSLWHLLSRQESGRGTEEGSGHADCAQSRCPGNEACQDRIGRRRGWRRSRQVQGAEREYSQAIHAADNASGHRSAE